MNNCCFTITVKFQIIFLPSFLSCWTVLKPCSMISTANIGQMYVILQSTAFRLDYFLPTKNPLNAWLSTYYVDNKLVIHVSFIIWLPNSKEVLLFFFLTPNTWDFEGTYYEALRRRKIVHHWTSFFCPTRMVYLYRTLPYKSENNVHVYSNKRLISLQG